MTEALPADVAAMLVQDANAPPPPPGHNSLAYLTDKAQQAAVLLKRIEAGEELLKQLKKDARELLERELPTEMAQLRLKTFSLEDGTVISVKDVVAGSIPAAKREEAFAWLHEHGHGALIRTKVVVEFGPGSLEAALKLVEELQSQPSLEAAGAVIEKTQAVHAQSLGKWAREMLQKGADMPLETLGIYAGKVAEFKLPSPSPTPATPGSRKTGPRNSTRQNQGN